MNNFKIVTAGAIALSALFYSGTASSAEPVAGVYLASNPGKSVEYLSLVDSGQNTAVGYLAAIRTSRTASTIQSRTQIFSKRIGNTLLFGSYCATPTTDGFMLTSITQDGGILQEHFIRSTVEGVNASIVALQESANRPKLQVVRSLRNTPVGLGGPVSATDSAQLWKAQAEMSTAQAQVSDAQDAAGHLQTLATQARAAANAAVDEPGVSFVQNQSRVQAMKQADDAEQRALAAEQRFNVARAAVANARDNVGRLRTHLATAAVPTLSDDSPSTSDAGP